MAKSSNALVTDAAVREFCNNVRLTAGQEYKHLGHAAHELRATLAPYGRVRAWIVAAHLSLASNAAKAASAHAVATYMAFIKHFEPELAAARAKQSRKSRGGSQQPGGGDGFRFGAN
jgi:hypothetical protein